MAEIPVLISINSTAHRDGLDHEETLSLFTAGTLTLNSDDSAVLHYEEQLDDSIPAQPVAVELSGDTVTMRRGGEYETVMMFRMGSRFEGMYHTPFGDFEIAIFCTRLFCDIGEGGGEIRLCYQLDMNGKFAAVHELQMNVYKKDE